MSFSLEKVGHLLLENDDQVLLLFFGFINQFNEITQADPTKSPYGIRDAIMAMTAAAAACSYSVKAFHGLKEFTEQDREELINKYVKTIDAMHKAGEVSQFLPH